MTTLELTVSRFVAHNARSAASTKARRPRCGSLCATPRSTAPACLRSSRRCCWMTSWRRGHARARVGSIICWVSCAACSNGPSRMSCWKPRRCRLARVGKRRRGSRSSSTSPKRDGCSMQPPRSPITGKPPNAERPTARSSRSATGWDCASVRRAPCVSVTSTHPQPARHQARQVRQESTRSARPADRRTRRPAAPAPT
jgi:hypothetical protein